MFKYLKYKKKYLSLKNKFGGNPSENINRTVYDTHGLKLGIIKIKLPEEGIYLLDNGNPIPINSKPSETDEPIWTFNKPGIMTSTIANPARAEYECVEPIIKDRKPTPKCTTHKVREAAAMLKISMLGDDYLKKIGPCKPVATPTNVEREGKSLSRFFIDKWNSLDESSKECLTEIYSKNCTLGVFINDKPGNRTNPIIFYSVEHLTLLAGIYNKNLEEVLEIIGTSGEKSPEDMDIIYIAFNDPLFRLSEQGEKSPRLTEQGEQNKKLYLSRAGVDIKY